jgi:hypothetical protein
MNVGILSAEQHKKNGFSSQRKCGNGGEGRRRLAERIVALFAGEIFFSFEVGCLSFWTLPDCRQYCRFSSPWNTTGRPFPPGFEKRRLVW